MDAKVLVIIVTYNAMQWIERCFSSLSSSLIIPDVYIVDNGSEDGTQDFIRKKFPNYIFVQSNNNLGFGKANNMGFQYAIENNYDYVYLLNQDAWIFPETINKLIEISENHPEYGILSPFQMEENLFKMDPGFFNDALIRNKQIFDDLYNQCLKPIYEVPVVMAAHWFMTIDCVRKVGGFSPSFIHYGEDYNYVDRLHYLGYKIGVLPTLRVVHDRGNRIDTDKKIKYLMYVNDIRSMSMPNTNTFKYLIYCFFLYVKRFLLSRSLIWFYYYFLILKNTRSIIRNKKVSMYEKCPFLKGRS